MPKLFSPSNRSFSPLLHLTLGATVLCCGVALSACQEERLVPSSAGPATNGFLVGRNSFTQPIPGLNEEERKAFIGGRTLFVQSWIQAPASTQSRDGLGPLFNARACETCHPKNGRSQPLNKHGELSPGLLFRVGTLLGPDPVYGGQVQISALPDIVAEAQFSRVFEAVPGRPELRRPVYQMKNLGYGPLAEGSGLSPRIGGALVGMGLLEAVPTERWKSLADPEDRDQDGISGRVHRVPSLEGQGEVMGRFGWKAEMPDLRAQTASAYHDDMGLTSHLRASVPCTQRQEKCLSAINGGDPEISDRALEETVRYVQLLAVPRSPDRMQGREWYRNLARFEKVGCADCHVPSHQTGGSDQGVLRPLADIEIWPFTDMLLHDMGPELADGRPLPGATVQEWRTPPLWGIGHIRRVNGHQFLLHDGRADGISQAIAWHGGEGAGAREAFFALSPVEQADLIHFIEQL